MLLTPDPRLHVAQQGALLMYTGTTMLAGSIAGIVYKESD